MSYLVHFKISQYEFKITPDIHRTLHVFTVDDIHALSICTVHIIQI